MNRLRHPVRSLKEPFGKAGLTVAILALVLAMVGGAYAAAGLNGKQKQEVIAIAKKYAGKSGAAGTNGTNGPEGKQGSQGLAGTNGTAGAEGKQGSQGLAGAAGTNGTNGTNGENGACSNADPDCTLPVNASLRGTFGIEGVASSAGEKVSFPYVSFVLPLKTAPQPSLIRHTVLEGSATGDLEEGSRYITESEHLISGYETFGATVTGPGIAPGTVIVSCKTQSGETSINGCGDQSCGTNNPPTPGDPCASGAHEIYLSKPAEATASEVTLNFGLPEGCTATYEPEPAGGEGNTPPPRLLPHSIGAAPGHLCLFEGPPIAGNTEGLGNLETQYAGVLPLPLFQAPAAGAVQEVDPEGFGLVDFAEEAGRWGLSGNWVVTGD